MTDHDWKDTPLRLHATDRVPEANLYLPSDEAVSKDSTTSGDQSAGRRLKVLWRDDTSLTADLSVAEGAAIGGTGRCQLRAPRWRDDIRRQGCCGKGRFAPE
ncbi:hypothetical protein ACFVSN_40530 [Kitasatospora sp. NPDC057904]|uniref:hypothetical protein n=1 Tax=Kitasatospora sp. NPDC057904 TaxID=3346275 RepID=UPI0036DD09B1